MSMAFRKHQVALAAAAWLLVAGSVQAAEKPLTGAAWQHADQAYKAYASGNFAQALQQAQAARRLRPDMARLADLEAKAQSALNDAVAARAEQTQVQQAQALAQQAYAKAQDASQLRAAAGDMQQALQLNPQPLPWHVLLARLLLQDQRWGEAVTAIDSALQTHHNEAVLLQAKAYALQQLGQKAQALQVLDQALLHAQGLSAQDRASVLRQGVDTALFTRGAEQDEAQGEAPREPAQAWLSQLQALSASDAVARQALLQSTVRPPLAILAPDLACNQDGICVARYAFDIESGMANAAYAAAQAQQWAQVLSLSETLLQLQPAKGAYWQLQIAAQQGLGRDDAARASAQQALQSMQGQAEAGLTQLQLAQVAHTAGDRQAEASFYNAAEQAQGIAAPQLEDAAFAAEHVGDAPAAVRRHTAALDSADAGQIAMSAQQRQGLRLAVGDLDREWGSSAGVFSSRGSTLPGGQSAASGYRSVQTVGELYWRPQALRGDGTFVDLYGRYMGNLRAAPQDAQGQESAQLALGLRAKPFGSQNFIVAAERWIKLGDASRNDWLLRAAYSYTKDMYGPVNRDRWMTGDLYLEAGRYLHAGEKYATGELRYGPQWRLKGSDSGDWGLWGYGVAAAEYNSSYRRSAASSAGVGVSLRRWLREDREHAGRSWVDFTLQYRVHLGGDDRASGLVARASWFY